MPQATDLGAAAHVRPISQISQNRTLNRIKAAWPVVVWFSGPVLIRLAAMQLNHQWDVQTWYTLFTDFRLDHSPYDTLRTLSYETRVDRSGMFYEYYAYPPGLIYLYWPLAKLYALFDSAGATYHLGQQGLPAVIPIPWFFNYFFKMPLLLADIGIAALLWKMVGRNTARRYVWNIYPIMALAWQFDTLVALTILWSVYALERRRIYQAAIALALGAVIKFVPFFLVPAVLLYMLRCGYSLRQIMAFGLVFGGVCAAPVLPYLDGTLFALDFQASRIGGGLSWHSFFVFIPLWTDWLGYIEAANLSAAIGALVLPLGLMWVYAYTYRRNLTINSTLLVTLLGYLAFTKIVNEVYLLDVLPLMLLELARHPSRAKEWYYRLFWSVPVAIAIIRAPLPYFLNSALAGLGKLNQESLLDLPYWQDTKSLSLLLFVVGTFFTILLCTAIPRFAIPAGEQDFEYRATTHRNEQVKQEQYL
jgi:hypothetical protein